MRIKIELCIRLLAAVVAAPMPLSHSAFAEEATQTAIAEPEPAEAEKAASGKALYVQHCWHCHGPNMVNPGTVTFDLRRFPHDDKARFVHSVTTGKNGRMPAWGDLLSESDIDKLWAYVKTGGTQ